MAKVVDCTGCGRFLPGRNRVSVLERNIYLLMLGLDNSGKTCTAKTLVGESLENVAPTIGFSKVSTKYKGFNVTIYDLGGSKSFRGIWPKYYHEVHGFVFVVDASDNSRMEETAEVNVGDTGEDTLIQGDSFCCANFKLVTTQKIIPFYGQSYIFIEISQLTMYIFKISDH